MKRIIALLLVLCLVLCGCAAEPAPTEPPTEAPTEAPVVMPTVAPTEAATIPVTEPATEPVQQLPEPTVPAAQEPPQSKSWIGLVIIGAVGAFLLMGIIVVGLSNRRGRYSKRRRKR